MASPYNFDTAQRMQINVITKKLRLGPKHVAQLEQAKKQGVPGVEALANVLGVKPGEDPADFIRGLLTEREYDLLATALDLAKDGNPLRKKA